MAEASGRGQAGAEQAEAEQPVELKTWLAVGGSIIGAFIGPCAAMQPRLRAGVRAETREGGVERAREGGSAREIGGPRMRCKTAMLYAVGIHLSKK